MAKSIGISIIALVAACAAAEPLAPEILSEGDECSRDGSNSGACAVNALQRSGHKIEAAEAAAVTGEDDSVFLDVPPSVPDLSFFGANVSLEELGQDELEQMIKSANEVLDARKSTSGGSPSLVELQADDELETEVNLTSSCGDSSYHGRRSGSELCFCQLAGNKGCRKDRCACPQGCRGVAWSSGATVTFKNRARAHGCGGPSTVLLTATRKYFRDTSSLKRSCGGGATSVLATMLRNSFSWYQSRVAKGPVNQCFHNPGVASVKYLHMQTFCARGEFHQMPKNRKNGVGFCVTMRSAGEAGKLAGRLAHWC